MMNNHCKFCLDYGPDDPLMREDVCFTCPYREDIYMHERIRNLYYMFLWKLHRIFGGGWNCITIKPTIACNYKCDYCCLNFTKEGRFPRYGKTISPDEWMEVLKPFGKVNVVSISGGEPMLYPHFIELVEKLTQKYHVRVITNLSLTTGLKLSPNKRLIFIPTFHKSQVDREDFESMVRMYKKKFMVLPRGFGEYTNINIAESNDDRLIQKKQYHPNISPDGTVYGSCVDMERGGK